MNVYIYTLDIHVYIYTLEKNIILEICKLVQFVIGKDLKFESFRKIVFNWICVNLLIVRIFDVFEVIFL